MASFDVNTTDWMELLPTIGRKPSKRVVPISIMELAGGCYCKILFSDESQVIYSPYSQQQMVEWSDVSRRNALALATWRIVPMTALWRIERVDAVFYDYECRRQTAWSRAAHNDAVKKMIRESRTP